MTASNHITTGIITTEAEDSWVIASGPMDTDPSHFLTALTRRFGSILNTNEMEFEIAGGLRHLFCRKFKIGTGRFVHRTKNCG